MLINSLKDTKEILQEINLNISKFKSKVDIVMYIDASFNKNQVKAKLLSS